MPSTTEFSPQDRLAITRNAIVRHMNRGHELDSNGEYSNSTIGDHRSHSGFMNAWNNVMHALLIWWQRHPASAVVELTSPLMRDYAGSHPFKLLGVSALIGSAVVMVKPWRMMSVGNWMIAAVKSSGLTSAIMSLLTRPRRKTRAGNSYDSFQKM